MTDLDFDWSTLMFNREMHGDDLQTLLSWWHAILRARRAIVSGFNFSGNADLVNHILRLVQHPWLSAAVPGSTSAERRAQRIREPEPVPDGVVLYRCDGASRNNGDQDGLVEASCGCVRFVGGVPEGRCARRLGPLTNNQAEARASDVALYSRWMCCSLQRIAKSRTRLKSSNACMYHDSSAWDRHAHRPEHCLTTSMESSCILHSAGCL